MNNNGKLIGNRFLDEKTIRLYKYYRNGRRGDKTLIYRTDIIRKYPQYPVFRNERFVPLGTKYMMIDQDFELLVLNVPVCVVEYMSDGSTMNIFRQYFNNPNGFAYARRVHMKYGKGACYRFKEAIHYVSSCIQAKKKRFLRESPKKITTILATPFGLYLWFSVGHRYRKQKRQDRLEHDSV